MIRLCSHFYSFFWLSCCGSTLIRKVKPALMLVALLALNACSVFPRISGSRSWHGNDKTTGEPISNAFTIASDIMMYVGIAAILIGLAMLIIFKRIIAGGQAIIFAFACFILSQGLSWFGSHWKMLCIVGVALAILAAFIYYKAVVTGLPWLEKLFNKDFNRDGFIDDVPAQGKKSPATPVPHPMPAADDGDELAALENPERNEPENGSEYIK